MENYNYNLLDWAGWGWGRAGRGGSKKSKPITTSPRGAGLKYCPRSTTFAGWGKPALGEARRGGLSKAKLPSLGLNNELR